jgi:hypothetical protein
MEKKKMMMMMITMRKKGKYFHRMADDADEPSTSIPSTTILSEKSSRN